MNRYVRQLILPEVGASGQASLKDARLLVVGAGGLGCPALQYLVGAGVGQITIIDPDRVSVSNLHRQILFREEQIGEPKAECAAKVLGGLNSDCDLSTVVAVLTPQNAADLVASADVILDCADSFAVSYILSDTCLVQGKPLISASALGLNGYVGGFCDKAPSLRAVFPDLPTTAQNCATAGVMGPVVGMIGAAQAQMALAVLLGIGTPLGQLVTFDLRTFKTGGFRFDTASEPEDALGFMAVGWVNETDFVVDLRGVDEAPEMVKQYAQRHVVDDFDDARLTPNADQRAVLTCRSGLRAWQAARKLQTYWNGEIKLIAMGDTPATERQDA